MSALPRRTGVASIATLAAFAAAFILVNLLAPHWAQSVGLDFWEIEASVANLKKETERTRDIGRIQERMGEQIAAGESIVAALIEGRMTLPHAVDQLVEINRDRPGFAEALTCFHHSAPTHRDRVEQYVLANLRSTLGNDPSRLAEVLKRLEADSRSAASHQ